MELVGADSSLSALGGALVRHTQLEPFGGIGAIVLPAPLARTIGVTKFGREATLQLAGRSVRAPLYEQLDERQIGPLVTSPIAVAPLSYAQEMAGLRGPPQPHPRAAGAAARELVCATALDAAGGGPAERRVDELRRTAVRQGRRGEQPVDGAVRGDQRARGVPVRVQRDAADGARSAAG